MKKEEKIVFDTLDKELTRLENESIIQVEMIKKMARTIEQLCKSSNIMLNFSLQLNNINKEYKDIFNIDNIIEYYKKEAEEEVKKIDYRNKQN